MSVDAGHRYQFCKLLKTYFPQTQFIITTHDRLWAEQMKSAGLVTAKTSIAFHGWGIDTGPLVESNQEIWDEIAATLGKGKVEVASAALRHHLEYVSRLLADQLGATPTFRADGNYELGGLLPSVLARMNKLYGTALASAQSWGNKMEKEAVTQRKAALSTAAAASNVEQWAVNKAVHYNVWANFGRRTSSPLSPHSKPFSHAFVAKPANRGCTSRPAEFRNRSAAAAARRVSISEKIQNSALSRSWNPASTVPRPPPLPRPRGQIG